MEFQKEKVTIEIKITKEFRDWLDNGVKATKTKFSDSIGEFFEMILRKELGIEFKESQNVLDLENLSNHHPN